MQPSLSVLLIEDSESDAELIEYELQHAGFRPVIKRIETASELSAALEEPSWDLVICDHGLPQFNALSALRILEGHGMDVPFIIVSGTIGEEVAVAAMKAGAHDYVLKGNLSRLPAAVERELREARSRRERREADRALRVANFRLTEALDELQRIQLRLVQQERLDALRQLAGGVVHDVYNLINPVLGYSELLLTYPERLANTEIARQDLQRINAAAVDVIQIIGHLRQFYHPNDETRPTELLDLNELARQAVALTAHQRERMAKEQGTAFEVGTDLQSLPQVRGNAAELREVFVNLILNAADAMPQGSRIYIRTRVHETGRPSVTVEDTGTGMSQETLKRCLEPFFTTKGSNGTGMGLAIVYGIVQSHEGSIAVTSELGQGTTVAMEFPVAEEQ